jgi:putative nucleotidyltransferase with HDIG domain
MSTAAAAAIQPEPSIDTAGLNHREMQLAGLLDQLAAHHPLTYDHCRRVASLSRQLAMTLEMVPSDVSSVFAAGLLHDIGHLQTPRELLSKREELTSDDWALLRAHPRVGAELLTGVVDDPPVLRCVLEHHERPDGDGYPSGNAVQHRVTAIVSVASTFDSITYNRWLQRSADQEHALQEIRRVTGTQLNETVVRALHALVGEPW